MRLFVIVAACVWASAAQAEMPQDPSGLKACSESKNATPSGERTARGEQPPESMAVERNAILPSAGQHDQSAAPTVQQDGKPVSGEKLADRAECQPKG
ncbi:MAG: hypothetical protein NW215_01820 [Hyphomicrobiales bacterium]|nr:hypothetical protein [Hyphomicrobiales bacterium]